MHTQFRVLIVEDRAADAELMLHELRHAGLEPEWQRVETEEEYLNHLLTRPDLILADYSLPQFDARRALQLLQDKGMDIPFIIITGAMGDETAAACIKRGATDYLLKDRLGRLGSAVQQAFEQKRLRAEKASAEKALREREEHLRLALNAANIGTWQWDIDDDKVIWSDNARKMFDLVEGNFDGTYQSYIHLIHEVDRGLVEKSFHDALNSGGAFYVEHRILESDMSVRWLAAQGELFRDDVGKPERMAGTFMDITSRKETEEEVAFLFDATHRQMDELGVLHAVAHAGVEALSEDELLARVTTVIALALYPDSFGVILLDEATRTLNPHLSYRASEDADLSPSSIESGVIGLVASQGKPRRVPDVSCEAAYVENDPNVKSELCVPLVVGEHVIGVINAESRHLNAFSETDERLLMTIAGQLATAIDRLRVEAAELYRAQQLAMIYDVGRQAASILALGELLPVIARLVCEAMNLYNVELALIQEDEILFRAGFGGYLQSIKLDGSTRQKLGQGIMGKVAMSGEQLLVPDVHDFPDFIVCAELPDVRSELCIPLRVKDQILGVLDVKSNRVCGITELDVAMLEILADQVSAAIENARLFEAEQRAHQNAKILRAANVALTQTLELDTVMETLLGYLLQVIPYDTATVYLLAENLKMVMRVSHDTKDQKEFVRMPAEDLHFEEYPTIQTVLNSGHSLLISNTRAYPDWETIAGWDDVESWLGVPLVAGGELIGLFSLGKAKVGFFTHDHLPLIEAMAAQAAAAIQNARLYEQVRIGRKRLQAMSQRLVEVQEAERRHIARELHDEIGQTLTGLNLILESMNGSSNGVSTRLTKAKSLVNGLMGQVHDLSLNLRPSMLDDLGLLATLAWHFRRYQVETDIQVNFEHGGLDRRFSPDLETAVYRIIQEALTNVARYSNVKLAEVRVWAIPDILHLQVEDVGTGFDSEALFVNGTSGGLTSMRERAVLLGGKLTVSSTPDAGTTVMATFAI